MRWSTRTKEAVVVSVFTFLVVAITTGLHLGQLSRVVVAEAERQADLIARQVYAQVGRALSRPGDGDPAERLRTDRELRSLVDASVGYSPHLVHVLLADAAGAILVHSEREREGEAVSERPTLHSLLHQGALGRFRALYGASEIYELALPMNLDGRAFASIRVGVSTGLLRPELSAAVRQSVTLAGLALAAAWCAGLVLAALALRPIRELARDVGRLRRGETPTESSPARKDELGELASQLQLLGRELQSDRVKALSDRAHLQHVVDILEDGVVFFTPDRRILFYNRATEAVVDRPLEEAVGLHVDELLDAAHPLRLLLDPAFEKREDFRNATIVLAVAGQTKELLVSAFFVADVERDLGAMVLLRDLESLKTLQSLISHSAKLAALGRLTSGVAHEVKNPLNAMMIHLELVKESLDAPPAQVSQSLQVIGSEIRRLDRVVQGFLKFVRPQELHPKPVDLGALAQAVAALVEAEAQKAGVRIAFELAPGLPAVSADEELLRQAFLNILQNAYQAMPAGGVVTIRTEWQRPDWIAVTFADEGVGIAPADVDRIFSLYYTTKPDGNGIGLSVVFRIVHMHDGAIDVESEPGRGTTMTVRLPLRA